MNIDEQMKEICGDSIPFRNCTNKVNLPNMSAEKKKKAISKKHKKSKVISSSEKKAASSLKKRMQAMNMNPSAVKFELLDDLQ